MSSQVERAVKLWLDLGHPGSAMNAYLISQRLTSILHDLSKEERSEYKEKIWIIVQRKIKKQAISEPKTCQGKGRSN